MSNDLYIRMVREKPRRKGAPPGEWEPFLIGPAHAYASAEDAVEAERYGIDAWNESARRLEHALFRVPAAAMEQVYPDAEGAPATAPTIVCLCGSTRFKDEFGRASLRETMAGKIVLSIGCDMRSDADLFGRMAAEEFARVKGKLDELHLRKIELANEVLILNVGGYIGESTGRELAHARKLGKHVRFLEPDKAPAVEQVYPAPQAKGVEHG